MAGYKFTKWNGFITMGIDDLLDFLKERGADLKKDRTVITGTSYHPERQEVSVFLTSMLTAKQDKELSKDWPFDIDTD